MDSVDMINVLARRAYEKVMDNGGTVEEANKAAQKVRNKGMYSGKESKALRRKRRLYEAFAASPDGNRCRICGRIPEDERSYVIMTTDDSYERQNVPCGVICQGCYRGRRKEHSWYVNRNVWDKLMDAKCEGTEWRVGRKAKLIWKVATQANNWTPEQKAAFEEYILSTDL